MLGQIQLTLLQHVDAKRPTLGLMLKVSSKGSKDTCITQAAVKALHTAPWATPTT
jgi:hypothetical protein